MEIQVSKEPYEVWLQIGDNVVLTACYTVVVATGGMPGVFTAIVPYLALLRKNESGGCILDDLMEATTLTIHVGISGVSNGTKVPSFSPVMSTTLLEVRDLEVEHDVDCDKPFIPGVISAEFGSSTACTHAKDCSCELEKLFKSGQ